MYKFKFVSQKNNTFGVIGSDDNYKTARWYVKDIAHGLHTVAVMADTARRDFADNGWTTPDITAAMTETGKTREQVVTEQIATRFNALPVAVPDFSKQDKKRNRFWS